MPFPYLAPPTPPQESDPHPAPPLSPSPPSYPTTTSNVLMGRSSFQRFVATRSRVVRIFNLPKDPAAQLAALFHPATPHAPLTLWSLRQEYGGPPPGHEDAVWAVFKSHDQASAALALSGATVSVATALESDLEPFQKLRRLDLRRHSVPSRPPPIVSPVNVPSVPSRIADLSRPPPLRTSQSVSDLRGNPAQDVAFTLSSNPPNPRNTFRQGDWICASLHCAAHNFMRNVVCIGCGNPRPLAGPSTAAPIPPFSLPWPRLAPSPRFAGAPLDHLEPHPSPPRNSLSKTPSLPSLQNPPPYPPITNSASSYINSFSHTVPSFPPALPPISISPTTPASSSSSSINAAAAAAAVALKLPSILTPSGRAFSIGGRVQNVSSDPLAPCVLYWPDNEPFPDQCQIRPPGNVGAQPPPILNTGNKGPIEQQPGDWVCGKCDYLNWRRRKVCQTCFPYAEGNTDGVSATTQAERIAMLAQVIGASQPQSQTAYQQQEILTNQPQIPNHLDHGDGNQHAHSIPTPPNDTIEYLYHSPNMASPETDRFLVSTSPCRGPLLPSFLDDDDYSPHTPSPRTPPSSLGSSSPHSPICPTLRKESSSSSLSFASGSSIWALKKDEVETVSIR